MHKITALIAATLLSVRGTQALSVASTENPYPVPSYCAFTQSKFLPFNNSDTNKNWKYAPTLSITVNGYPIIATMDTGSTGIVIDASYGFNETYLKSKCKEGHIFYTSSHWLEEGYWCTTEVDIGGVIAEALALVRTKEVCCPSFKPNVDGKKINRCQNIAKPCVCARTCTLAADQKLLDRHVDVLEKDEDISEIETRQSLTTGTAYMGIGFARTNPPEYNLFMNVRYIDGVATGSKFRTGYVITSSGVWIGITKNNTAGFSAIKLAQKPGSKADRDWGEPPCAVRIRNGEWSTGGTLLADTGIPNAYVKGSVAPEDLDEISINIPNASHPFGEVQFISVPISKSGTIGTDNPMQPSWVGIRGVLGVNTGRHFYNGYDAYFDGDGGYFGLRKKSD